MIRTMPLSRFRPMPVLRTLWLLLLSAFACPATPADPLVPTPVAAGVYAFLGAPEAPSPANGGLVSNYGVIVGDEGAIVIGTGTSHAHGLRLLQAIEQLARKPIVLAINTYAGPEHVLGNSAFAQRGVPILAHRDTDAFMVQNCALCIRNLKSDIGEQPLADSGLERPTQLIERTTRLDVGGRRIEILHFGWAHQPGDIAVFDPASGVLFAGALVSLDVLPDAHTADVRGWLEALRRLRQLPVKTVVPGRGPPAPPRRIDEVRDYLNALTATVDAAYAKGVGIREAARTAEVPHFRHWAMYDRLHPRNVHHLYLKLEARDLAQ
jgi:glyoxylase-like metal-dependent hydrolase (beta-lactamase superfamily II)